MSYNISKESNGVKLPVELRMQSSLLCKLKETSSSLKVCVRFENSHSLPVVQQKFNMALNSKHGQFKWKSYLFGLPNFARFPTAGKKTPGVLDCRHAYTVVSREVVQHLRLFLKRYVHEE